MDIFKPKPKKPAELFGRAIVFGIFFIIVLIFFLIVSKNDKSVESKTQLLNGLANYKGFDDKQKEDLKIKNAGFWQYSTEAGSANSIISMTDRLELKTNGIFWRVTRYAVGLPSKKTAGFIHVSTGYVEPFAKTGEGIDSIVCNVRLIRQVYINDKDTCYGPSNMDTTWKIIANGKQYEMFGNKYSSYDTSGQALFNFFPQGLLDIVDKTTVYQCRSETNFNVFFKNAVQSDMQTVVVDSLSSDAIQKIIDTYYCLILESDAGVFQFHKKRSQSLKVAFGVTWEGKVVDCSIVKFSLPDKKLEARLTSDICSWTFPRLKSNSPAKHIEREFWF
ncbi:MAG TPA: hypothetical protein DCO75_07605 [Fibrobacteres bacterium]|nr:hypothetical protein [Fibrobacterota bacterium]